MTVDCFGQVAAEIHARLPVVFGNAFRESKLFGAICAQDLLVVHESDRVQEFVNTSAFLELGAL